MVSPFSASTSRPSSVKVILVISSSFFFRSPFVFANGERLGVRGGDMHNVCRASALTLTLYPHKRAQRILPQVLRKPSKHTADGIGGSLSQSTDRCIGHHLRQILEQLFTPIASLEQRYGLL